jgi:hypothetical protein
MPRAGARLGFAIASSVVALIIAVVALGYLSQAAFLLLEAKGFSPAEAAAMTGAGGLVLAVLLALLARHFLHPAAAKPVAARRGSGLADDAAADLGALVAQQILMATRQHPYGTVGAALAAGLTVGAIPELRKTLAGFFKH